MPEIRIGTGAGLCVFEVEDARLGLRRLGALTWEGLLDARPRRVEGLVVVNTSAGRFEGSDWRCVGAESDGPDAATLRLEAPKAGLRLQSHWASDRATGVVLRRDTLTNIGSEPATILRCLARLGLPSGRHEVYAQQSRWCHENQGAWLPLHAGEIVLRCAPGRTTEGGTPYACVRDAGTRRGLACHILPRGNWTIRLRAETRMDRPPFAALELGLSDENLHLPLAPGESCELPELLFQALPEGDPTLAAPRLHQYLSAGCLGEPRREPPVIYNTWFDKFERLEPERLRRQLAAAQRVGCEVFMVDAGWYGAGEGGWASQVGDWREKPGAAFRGQMADFADEVRAAGLGFGLWMEPERIGPQAPVRLEHPEWFVPCGGAMARCDIARPEAWAWMRGEMGRLIETYRLAWMKIDFNFVLDADRSGRELSGYAAEWHRMLDDLREAYPDTFLEACASGGMRLDLEMLRHVDGHFLTDTAEPIDKLRITQGALLRLPPGRITRWACLRSVGQSIPRYGRDEADWPDTVVVAGGALWDPVHAVDLDFALLAAMPGLFGLSGDLAGLSPGALDRVAEHVAFFKNWRGFIARSVAHLLTPPAPIGERSGWVALQLQDPADSTSLLFVYRLGVAPEPPRWRLRGLRADARYTVQRMLTDDAPEETLSGAELMADGLRVALPGSGSTRNAAAGVYALRPEA